MNRLFSKVYICGGYDGVTSLSTVECYHPKTDSWSTVKSKKDLLIPSNDLTHKCKIMMF